LAPLLTMLAMLAMLTWLADSIGARQTRQIDGQTGAAN